MAPDSAGSSCSMQCHLSERKRQCEWMDGSCIGSSGTYTCAFEPEEKLFVVGAVVVVIGIIAASVLGNTTSAGENIKIQLLVHTG